MSPSRATVVVLSDGFCPDNGVIVARPEALALTACLLSPDRTYPVPEDALCDEGYASREGESRSGPASRNMKPGGLRADSLLKSMEVAAMMGPRQIGQGQPFYDFSLEAMVPADHLLRSLDHFVDLSSVRPLLAPSYSSTGRPSVDPELMIRRLLVGYCYGIGSERRLCEEVGLNLACRWFCRLDLTDPVPDHSTFSKNRHGRFRDYDLLRQIFETVLARCIAEGLVGGRLFGADALRNMILRTEDTFGLHPETLVADTAYGAGEMLGWLVDEQGIDPHIPVFDKTERSDGAFPATAFSFDPEAVPPLHGSKFAKAGPEVVAQIMQCGIDGPIRVKGFTCDSHMPGFAGAPDVGEVSQLASYVAGRLGGAGAVPLAALGVIGPALAAAAMLASSVSGVLNSPRLHEAVAGERPVSPLRRTSRLLPGTTETLEKS